LPRIIAVHCTSEPTALFSAANSRTSRQAASRRSCSSCGTRGIVARQTIAGRAAGTLNAEAQLAVSTNPSKLRRPRRALADVVLIAALEMSHEPPAHAPRRRLHPKKMPAHTIAS